MNKTITIYELLGLIKDGKAPKKIKCEGKVYEYKEGVEGTGYRFETGTFRIWFNYEINLDVKKNLNRKIEILEEDKPIIEKLDVALLSQSDNWLWCPSKDEFSKDIELNSYIIQNIRENTLYFQRKINEIIDYINRKEKNEQTKNR